MFVIIKKGEIIKSKWTKTNQESPIGFNYYKLIYFMKRIFQTKTANEAFVWCYSLSVSKTVWTNFALSWLFYRFQSSAAEGTKERRHELIIFNGLKLQCQQKDLHQKACSTAMSEYKRSFLHTFSEPQMWMSRNVQVVRCKSK